MDVLSILLRILFEVQTCVFGCWQSLTCCTSCVWHICILTSLTASAAHAKSWFDFPETSYISSCTSLNIWEAALCSAAPGCHELTHKPTFFHFTQMFSFTVEVAQESLGLSCGQSQAAEGLTPVNSLQVPFTYSLWFGLFFLQHKTSLWSVSKLWRAGF